MIEILAFEGPDKVGKSTVIHALNRATNYRFLCIDRFLGSAWVYDALSGRRNRESDIMSAETELGTLACARVVNIILTCDRDSLAQRIIAEDEYADDRLRKLDQMIDLYERYAATTRLRCIQIDTTSSTDVSTVEKIIQKLGEFDV